jgi:2-desacetyl-2-hydroxyethyl bacteriochlorophyllide A dehydrogenase
MKAVVFTEQLDYELADRPKPSPGPSQLLVEVDFCGICGTDLHAPRTGDLFLKPVVLGHEFAATVAEIGGAVEGFAPGERVVINPMATHCGKCRACLAGRPHICEVTLSSGTLGIGTDGGMAEYALIEPAHAHRLPAGVAAEVAAWAEPLGVAIRGVRQGRVEIGDTVAVFGAGPIGQLTVQAARAAGASEVLVVETSEYRRRIAVECGATQAIEPGEVGAVDRLYDVVLDCTGAPPAFDSVLDLANFGGRVVVLGTHSGPVTIDQPIVSHLKETSITWSLCYRDGVEFATALKMLADGKVDVGPLTSGIVPLEDFAEAFAAMNDPEQAVKLLLSPTAG